MVRPLELGGQRVAALLQGCDHALAVGGALSVGDCGTAGRKPFDLLELDAIPGRIADHRVKAAAPFGALPIRPDTGKGDLPVEKAFLRIQLPNVGKDGGEAGARGMAGTRWPCPQRDLDGVAERSFRKGPAPQPRPAGP